MKILLVGFGDVAKRLAAKQLAANDAYSLIGAGRSRPNSTDDVRLRFIPADLDSPASLARLAGLADVVVMLAPPLTAGRAAVADTAGGAVDTRSRHLAAALSRRTLPRRLVYVSTTGVYGDCYDQGLIDETRAVNPQSERALRRVDAEQTWRSWCRRNRVALSILRVPGIYAADRLPLDRLKAGTPALLPEQDRYSNHIHADDLAAIIMRCVTARRAVGGRVFNTVDESDLKMGEYFDLVADTLGYPRVPRGSLEAVRAAVSPMTWSFMRESRRIVCGPQSRLQRELRIKLLYPTVAHSL